MIDEDLAVALRVPRYFDSEDVLLAASAGPRCHRCGEKGHIARECRGTPKLRPCHLCAEIGHDANACPNQGALQAAHAAPLRTGPSATPRQE